MIVIPSTINDVRRYYENTFVKFSDFGDTLFFIERVRDNMLSGRREDDELFELDVFAESPFELGFVLPHRAVFQYGNQACLLRRVPAKQYFRGIHKENTRITSTGSGEQLYLSFETLRAFVNKQKYFTLEEALENKDSHYSHALSSRFSYVYHSHEVLLDETCIAYVDVAERKLHLKHSIFQPEILDFLKQTNSTMEVS